MSDHSRADRLDAFRQEVRSFLREAVPPDIRAASRAHCLVTREQAVRWQRILHARGWAAPGWPREHGGPGWSLVEQAIFREELAASDAPRYDNLGIDTIGPTLIRYGTPEQCRRFLPGMLSFDDFWAQGYSEPDAGSDLASAHRCAARWRRMGRQWQQDLADPGPVGQLGAGAGPHRSGRPTQARGHLGAADGPARTGRDGAADPLYQRRALPRADVLRRRAGARGQPGGRGTRRLVDRQGTAGDRAPVRRAGGGLQGGAGQRRETGRHMAPGPRRTDRGRFAGAPACRAGYSHARARSRMVAGGAAGRAGRQPGAGSLAAQARWQPAAAGPAYVQAGCAGRPDIALRSPRARWRAQSGVTFPWACREFSAALLALSWHHAGGGLVGDTTPDCCQGCVRRTDRDRPSPPG